MVERLNLAKAVGRCCKRGAKIAQSIAFLGESVKNNQRAFGFSLITTSITF
ncbi:hypothetical protein JMUB7507_26660 [Staphylococcus aureus]